MVFGKARGDGITLSRLYSQTFPSPIDVPQEVFTRLTDLQKEIMKQSRMLKTVTERQDDILIMRSDMVRRGMHHDDPWMVNNLISLNQIEHDRNEILDTIQDIEQTISQLAAQYNLVRVN
jgi:hypothetical protein